MNSRTSLGTAFRSCLVLSSLILCAAVGPAWGGDRFALQGNLLVGNQDVFHAEIPLSMTPQALIAEPSNQDLFTVGILYNNMPGIMPTLGAIRYGRGGDRGEARIIAGPAELGIAYQAGATYSIRGGVASGPMGPVLSLTTGTDAKLYFYLARNLGQFVPSGNTQNFIDLAQSSLATKPYRIVAVVGSGTKIYAADGTQPIVAQLDLMTGALGLCKVDSQPTGLALTDQGKIQLFTNKGTVQFTGDCTATTLMTTAPVVMVPGPDTLDLPSRSFAITERVIEPTMQPLVANAKGRRGTYVSIVGTTSTTVTINAGTCIRTTFLAGDTFATPTATTQLNLTQAVNNLALYAEQTAPGEDCYAILSSGLGEALLRIRGSVEGLGATVFMADRSWSMERSWRGVGAAANVDEQRTSALRTALVSLLGTIDLPSVSSGPWAFMPFTDDAPSAWSSPSTGFSTVPDITNPDSPTGMRIKGFAATGSDKLDPGGPSDLTQAMRAGLTRLQIADTLPVATTGWARRLWVLSDNQSGRKGYVEYQKLLSTFLKNKTSLRYFGIGGFGLDPLLQQMVAQTWGFSGDRMYGPVRGQAIEVHTPSTLHEAVVAATVRESLRGRPVGIIGRGELNKASNKSAVATFKLNREAVTNREDAWLIIMAAWDHADATPTLSVVANGNTIYLRCFTSNNSMLCASPGFAGDWTATLTTSRTGNLSTFGVVRAFVGAWGPNGEVMLHTSFARSLYKSGQKVRVQVALSERGLPLRLASVTARVFGPNLALGTLAGQSKVAQDEIAGLLSANGDLSPGQAKVELLDPTSLPAQKPVAMNLVLYDDGVNGNDNQSQDGIYQAEFQAFIPGIYTVDVHVDYSGLFPNNVGTIEDRITTNVVAAIDPALTGGSVNSEAISGGLRLRFTPQDAGKNFLGPGQAGAMLIAQGTKLATVAFDDFLDGSYRADVTGLDLTKPFDLIAPGSRAQLYNPANPNPNPPGMAGGCSTVPGAASAPLFGGLLLLSALLLLSRRRLSRESA